MNALEYFGGNELAADVWTSKYALKDRNGNLLEQTPKDMHHRLAREFARIEAKYPNPLAENQIFQLLDQFQYIIPQGSPMSAIGNNTVLESLSNCFVIAGPDDSIGGIHFTDEEMAQLMKRRGGVGFNINNLRPAEAPVDNSALTSTGAVSFMDGFSFTCRKIAQKGRRGALMQSLSVRHPDAEAFATVKQDLTKVTGANISLMLDDTFLQAVESDLEYTQQWPVSGSAKVTRTISASELWKTIIHCAWKTAEPGLAFIDTIQRSSPSDFYPEFASESCNPCCFSENQDVTTITNHGLKNLRDVRDTDLIWVDTAKAWAETSGYFSVGLQPIKKITFSNQESFEVTPNHKWITAKEKRLGTTITHIPDQAIETESLRVGDKVCLHYNPVELPWGNEGTLEEGYIVGKKQNQLIDILTAYDEAKHKRSSNYVRVVSIDDMPPAIAGCIEVKDHHQFTANGVISSNSEIWMGPYDSCRLILLNLFGYVVNPFRDDAYFDYKLFALHVRHALRLNDDMIDLEVEKIDKILTKLLASDEDPEKTRREIQLWQKIRVTALAGRRTGLGITALGDVIAALGMVYGSQESIELTEQIYKTLELGAYTESILLASERGAFQAFNAKEITHPFLNKIYRELDPVCQHLWETSGRRNIALTTTAPAGSVSLLAKIGPYRGTTSGIEPVFQASYVRKRKVTNTADFKDALGDNWQEYEVLHAGYQLMRDILEQELQEGGYAQSPAIYTMAEANKIDWVQRVRLQAAAQRWVDHAISSTINLPNDVSEETVAQVYLEAWKSGCKGITVYRDGCRDGVLTSKKSSEHKSTTVDAIKRPEELVAELHPLKEGTLAIGLLNGRPFEIFVLTENIESEDAVIQKTKLKTKNRYSLLLNGKTISKDLVSKADPDVLALTRLVSLNLRHGTPIQYIVEQLNKAKLSNFSSLPAQIARCLKEFIPAGTKSGTCPNCPGTLIYQEGCLLCQNCGYSKCG